MTVKSLSTEQKNDIADHFAYGMSLNSLAILYGRHRTTIVRALEEMGIDPGIRRRVPKSTLPLNLVKVTEGLGQTVVAVEPTPSYPITDPQPMPKTNSWFRRIGAFFGSLRHQGVASQ